MILRYPEYYEQFSCIADKCEDTCCAGWEIDIDDESYAYYMGIEGEYGDLIRSRIKEYDLDEEDGYESHGFILKEGKRCPFLNKNNLCDMILTLGEDAICDVCTYTPRNFLEYGNAREIAISPSCAEAGRLIFGNREKVKFIEKEIEESLDFEESQEDLELAEIILAARNFAIAILQNREQDIYQRMCEFLDFAKEVQQCLNENAFCKVYERINAWESPKSETKQNKNAMDAGSVQDSERYFYFQKRMESFLGMESINEEWHHYMEQMKNHFLTNGTPLEYAGTLQRFTQYLKENDREYEYEQLAVYYAFLMLSRCVDDLNFWGKAQFVAVNFLMIRDMDMERFAQNQEIFTPEDRVDIARIYAKEVEHSEENLEYLEDEFLFETIYQKEDLVKQIMTDRL
ncbi:MAG: flagellin lysine-N-methylase [Butyribacter sp.]|nr:flagellin lysine-N-methylase [bacterium]MDY3853799.1 flagellin lysine-N-methylase [Butyribacter sp.]